MQGWRNETAIDSTDEVMYSEMSDWWFLLPHDTMRKRGLCRRPVSVCLSVRPFVCHVRVLYPDG